MCAYRFCEFHQFLCNILPTAVHLCKKTVAVIYILCMRGWYSKKSILPPKGHSSWRRLFQAGKFWIYCGPTFFFIWEFFFTYNTEKKSQNDAVLRVLLLIKVLFCLRFRGVNFSMLYQTGWKTVFSGEHLFQRDTSWGHKELSRSLQIQPRNSIPMKQAALPLNFISFITSHHTTFSCQQTARRPSQMFQVQSNFLPNILQL